MNNYKLLFTLIFPVILFAGNINLSFGNHHGQSFYIVESANTQNLRSKLVFPFNFNSIGLEYNQKFHYFTIGINSSFLLNTTQTEGKDYDWQNNNLTVYSKSNNKISKYHAIGITLLKALSNNVTLFTKFNYSTLDMYWLNTYQEDYIKNKNEFISGNTLEFKQKFYKYNLGISYKNTIFKKLSLAFSPSLIYAYINTKDIHILRDFYTIQNIKSFGYEVNLNLKYDITTISSLMISFNYIDINDKNINMDYYNKLNKNYISYPSSYSYKDKVLRIHYTYNF